MSFFADMFKTTTPAAPAPAPAPASGLSAPIASPEKLPEGTPVNPLDAYKKMYDDSAKNSDIEAPSFKLDPAVLSKVSGEMDFTKSVDPELMARAMTGDAKSIIDVMQAVGRNAYSASLEHTTSLTDAHIANRSAFDQQRVDKGVKTQLTQNALATAPNYSHPVVKAELNRVANSFAKANPDASPQQVAEAAQKFISELQSALTPAQTAEERQATGEIDWSKYVS